MKHSKQYNRIRVRPIRNWWRRNRIMVYIFSSVIVIAVGIVWWNYASAMNYKAIQKCISTARALNQYQFTHLDPQSCVNDPYKIR